MPFVKHNESLSATPSASPIIETEAPGFLDVLPAAFRQENDVNAAWDALTGPEFPADPAFLIQDAMDASPYRYDYHEQLARAQSQAEFDAISAKITQEQADRVDLASAGGAGIAASIVAGVTSPTMFIPLMGPAKGAKGVAQAIALGATAATSQEAALYFSQETRTGEEVALGIGAGTILAGALGSAGVYLRGAQRARVEADMAHGQGAETISYAAGTSAGAAVEAAPTSPLRNLSEPIPPYRPKVSQVDDEVLVFDGQGDGVVARVSRTGGEGVEMVLDSGETVVLGGSLTQYNPRLPDYELQLEGFSTPVAKIASKELGELAEMYEVQLARLPSGDKSAATTKLQQDYVALISEADRRVAKATTPTGRTKFVEPELEAAAAKGADLPEQVIPNQGTRPIVPESVGAAVSPGALRPRRGIYKAGPVTGWINDKLKKLNPVTRLLDGASAVGSFWSAKFADAGLLLEGNQAGIAHAAGGTISDRAIAHQVALGKFVQSYDNAYANYVNGTNHAVDDAEGVFRAKVRSGLGQLPEGVMTWEEFGTTTFKLANTGDTHANSSVMAGVKSQLSLYDYFRKVSDEAYEERVRLEGPQARRLYDPEGNLGPDVENYIHHIYDTQAIGRNPTEFQNLIRDNYIQQQQSSFKKAVEKFVAKEADEQLTLDMLGMDKKTRKVVQAQTDKDIAAIEAEPEMKAFMDERKQLMDERTAARARAKEAKVEIDVTDLSPAEADAALSRWQDDLTLANDTLADAEVAVKEFEDSASQTVLGAQTRLASVRRYARKLDNTADSTPKRIESQEAKMEKAQDRFTEKWREKGATDISIKERSADFTIRGEESAAILYNDITGMGTRVAGMDIVQGARGPELARALNIPFDQKLKFLMTEPEHVIRRYTRQMSSDVEIYRATGSPNGKVIFDEMTEEFDITRRQMDAATYVAKVDGMLRPVAANAKGAKPVTEQLRVKMLDDLRKIQNQTFSDMTVLVDRQRHLRGMPDNPEGWAFRGGRMAMDMNVTRLMGTVMLSSMADVARPVMKRGLLNTFRDGYGPLVSDLARLKMTRANARELGIAWDPILHNRTQAVFEMMEDNGLPRTGAEKVTGFLANKTGLVAGFDRWTAEMKLIAASVGMSDTSRMLRHVVEGGGTAKELAEATKFLAQHGVEKPMADKIWKQFMKPGGSTEFEGGVRLPNLEAWADDYKTMSAYRALMTKFTDDTIITPGLDRPSWVDANVAAKMLAQFRSFTFTSTNRVVMAGLQQKDMALVNGIIISLAMGSLSYYLWATSVGGKAEEQMLSGDLDKWADEAIARSGLTGIFAEGQRIAERIPGLEQFATFSGKPVRNRQPTSLIGSIAGPSYDLAERMSKVVLGMDDPTQQTLHQVRLMTAYQNVFWWRQIMDTIEDSAADALDLPERRSN